MHRTNLTRRAAAALALALLATTACSDSTGPSNKGLSAADAITQLERGVAADTTDGNGWRVGYISDGLLGLQLGADVAPLTVSLDGHSTTFNSISYAETDKDSVDTDGNGYNDAVAYDSAAITLAWHGDSAQEILSIYHYGSDNLVLSAARTRGLLTHLATTSRNPMVTRAAARALTASGYGYHNANYITATEYWYSDGYDAAQATLVAGGTNCSMRNDVSGRNPYAWWTGLEAGDSCKKASLTTGFSGTLYPESGSGTKELQVAPQTVSAPRLFIDWSNDAQQL